MTIDITETVDTLKHVQGLKQSIPIEWTQQNKQPGQRALDALRVVEQADSEGRDVFIKDIAVALGITVGRVHQLVLKLQRARRVKYKNVGHKRALTTLFTAEDLALPWHQEAPETPKDFRRHCERLADQRKREQERIREEKKREAEAKLWVWNPHGWIYLPDWKARYDFPNGGPV